MRGIVGLFASVALVGCTVKEEDFSTSFADASCDQEYKCHRSDFEANYADMTDCEASYKDMMDSLADIQDLFNNTYSEPDGTDCVHAIRRASCSEFDDGSYDGACDVGAVWR